MIEIKRAVEISLETLKNVPLMQGPTSVELEEVEMEHHGNDDYWVVTFSYPDPSADAELAAAGPNLAALLRHKRAYKSVRVLASDGSVRGIKSIHG